MSMRLYSVLGNMFYAYALTQRINAYGMNLEVAVNRINQLNVDENGDLIHFELQDKRVMVYIEMTLANKKEWLDEISFQIWRKRGNVKC